MTDLLLYHVQVIKALPETSACILFGTARIQGHLAQSARSVQKDDVVGLTTGVSPRSARTISALRCTPPHDSSKEPFLVDALIITGLGDYPD